MERRDPVAAFGLDAVGIDLDGQRESAVELAPAAFDSVDACLVGLFDRLRTAMRMVLPLASMRRSDLRTPGTSMTSTMSSPLRKTFIGG
jgi:hypothetical protein